MVVRRPLCVGGEMEGGGLLKGDLDLLGLGGDVLVERTGMRDGLGVEVVTVACTGTALIHLYLGSGAGALKILDGKTV